MNFLNAYPARRRAVALFVLAVVLGGGAFAQQSGLNRILERGVIRVGTTGDFNPMSFKEPGSGKYAGFDIDMANQLAKDIGVKVEFVATDWKNIVNGIVAGRYDIATGTSYNMGRAKTAGYTLPYTQVGTVPLTLKANASKFRSWDDINRRGTTVAVTLGTVFDEQARGLFPNATIKAVESPARDFQEVLARRADVSVTSTIEAASLVKTYPDLVVVKVDAPRYSNGIGMLVAQNDQVLINYLNVWVTTKQYQGFLEDLRRKWIKLD